MNEISALFSQGAMAQALAKCDALANAYPDSDMVRYAQGMIRQKTGDGDGAIESYQAVVDIAPNHLQALVNLGGILFAAGRAPEAIEPLQRALSLDPANHPARNNLAHALFAAGKDKEALAEVEVALSQQGGSYELHMLNLQINDRLDRFEQSILSARRMIDLRPQERDGYLYLAANLRSLGRFEEAEAALKQCLKALPADLEAHAALSAVRRDPDDEAVSLAVFEKALAPGQLSQQDEITAAFAQANLLDRAGRFDEAFPLYDRANTLKSGLESYNKPRAEKFLADTRAVFTPEFLAERAGWGDASVEPIFIVGMPRSGSTLVEQILSGHAGADGIGERGMFELLCNRDLSVENHFAGYRDRMLGLTEEDVRAYGQSYLKTAGAGGRPVDKSLWNFNAIGLISLVFPKARILYCRRHPLDICLSCFQQNFLPGQVPYANSFAHLIHAFELCQSTLAYFEEVLPGRVQVVDYENLVADAEAASAFLFDLAGLEQDAETREHTDVEKGVRTASVWQARQPIYQTSALKWQAYEKHLAPLQEGLAGYLPAEG
ncbi:MAG: tetratricopeptide repeat protein [Pseudomonadota bacterium]